MHNHDEEAQGYERNKTHIYTHTHTISSRHIQSTLRLSLYATVLSTTLLVMLPLRECFDVDALPGSCVCARAFEELCGVPYNDIARRYDARLLAHENQRKLSNIIYSK